MSSVDDTLKSRGETYGEYKDYARICSGFKKILSEVDNPLLTPIHTEALDMIFGKIARILNGDPNFIEGWHDLAGYASLVERELEQTEGATNARVVISERTEEGWVQRDTNPNLNSRNTND